MADLDVIKQVVSALILSFDRSYSPNDIIEAFEDALDEYENLINTRTKF